MNLDHVATAILATPGPVRLVAVDGPGGSGKSTLAALLAANLADAPVIHTDDFASAKNPIDWWPRLKQQVVDPLVIGEAARYRRYDWPSESLAEWNIVEPSPVVIIEGVSAGRGRVLHSRPDS